MGDKVNLFRNASGKPDPTAGQALARVLREQRRENARNGVTDAEIQLASEFLGQIIHLRREIASLRDIHEQIIAGAEMRNSTPSGMPRGGCVDWTDAVDRAMEKAVEVEQAIACLDRVIREAEAMVRSVDSVSHRRVLYARYINGMAFTEIAQNMALDASRVRHIHGEALAMVARKMKEGQNDG